MRLLLWHFRAGLIKIRTSIKPGNLSFCKDQLSDQIETNTPDIPGLGIFLKIWFTTLITRLQLLL